MADGSFVSINHQPSERSEESMEIQARPEITGARADAIVIGLLAGMFSALLGVGGGLLMVPAMVYLLRIGPQRAHGTSLAVMLPTAIAGVSQYAGDLEGKWGVVLVGIVMIWRAAMELGVAPELRATPSGAAFPASVFPWPNLLLVGVGVGFLSGLLGVGGGTLMVPVLVFLLGQRQHAAQGIA